MVSNESQAAMDNAAKAVREFMTKNGHHDTTVYELVRPAVYHETITRNEREEVVTVLDQERHQTHLHISVQPITDEETREPQHSDRILPVEKRVFEHDDRDEVRLRLDAEQAKFYDHVEVVLGQRTRDIQPAVTGEHIHHHVREYIQPVVNKRTIEPHVIHELILKHEVHHMATIHHRASMLPEVTMAEFKRQGGILTGREERFDFFEGEPRSIGGTLGNTEQQNTSSVAGDRKTASSGTQTGVAPQPQAAQPTQQGQAAVPQVTEPSSSAASAPPFPVPERRATLAQQQHLAQPSQDTSRLPTTTATNANIGAGGRWSLLPMHIAKSGAAAHLPTTRSAMQPLHPAQARPSIDQQRQASTTRPGSPSPDTRSRPAQQ